MMMVVVVVGGDAIYSQDGIRSGVIVRVCVRERERKTGREKSRMPRQDNLKYSSGEWQRSGTRCFAAAAAASCCCKSAVEADFPVLLAVGYLYSIAMLPPIDAISCPGVEKSALPRIVTGLGPLNLM